MNTRLFLRLLLAFALAFAGGAAQLHALSHAQADLADAAGAEASGQKAPAPLKHSTDQCLVVHALDGTAAETGALPVAIDSSHRVSQLPAARSGESPAAAFQSRAPPVLS